ncbi:MAG: hypothetical protein Q9224_006793, partial [Gallowayella concinna]
PNPPFPEIYVLTGVDHRAFIHIRHVFGSIKAARFTVVTQRLRLTLANLIRYQGDQVVPPKGLEKEFERLELFVQPNPYKR